MRQLTHHVRGVLNERISKLPMRQLTLYLAIYKTGAISKLPMRQLTFIRYYRDF